MSDARLRDLERRWRASGLEEDEAAYLIACARSGAPYRLGPLVTCSPAMRRACEEARSASAAGTPLLLIGETGSGRATLARAAHDASPRGARPFVRQGSARGAPRGSDHAVETDLEELLRCAGGGGSALLTLYPESSPALLSGLRRYVQERHVFPFRSGLSSDLDASLIVRADALTPDVERLREGLPFVTVRVPALRERSADLELEPFLAAVHPQPPRLTAAARALLAEHAWPGNGRELSFVLEQAAARLVPGEPLEAELLPELWAEWRRIHPDPVRPYRTWLPWPPT